MKNELSKEDQERIEKAAKSLIYIENPLLPDDVAMIIVSSNVYKFLEIEKLKK